MPASYPHTLQCGWKPIWGLSVFKVIDGPLVFNRLDTGLQVHIISPNMHMRPDTCLPHPPTPFSINYIRVCIYCGNASGPSAGDKRNIKWFSHWFTWEKYTIWKPALIILIIIEKKIRQKIKTESFGNCWQVICLQVWDEVQKLHANNCSVNSNLWIKFIIDINDFQHDTFRVQLVSRFFWSEKKIKNHNLN